MADVFSVVRENTDIAGRYVIHLHDGSEAEMTYRWTGPGAMAIDHTGVPDAWRNRGLAMMLVEAGIADAKREGTKVTPYCSYVAAQFRRHPAWSDVLA